MNRKKRRFLNLVLTLVFLVSTVLLARSVVDSIRAERDYSDAQALSAVPGTAPTQDFRIEAAPATPEDPSSEEASTVTYWIPATVEDDPVMTELMERDLGALQEKNPDVVGWIYIPGSKINYPVTQGEDNDFYLEHNWRGEKLASGSIFLECQNSNDFTNYNTIVYGHNMVSGSMFGALRNYASQKYWEKHPYIYILTEYGVLRYEVFSSYTTTVGSDTYRLGFRQAQTRQNYLQMAAEQSEIDTGIAPEITDLVLTLSTCASGRDVRRIVHARLPMIQYFPE